MILFSQLRDFCEKELGPRNFKTDFLVFKHYGMTYENFGLKKNISPSSNDVISKERVQNPDLP